MSKGRSIVYGARASSVLYQYLRGSKRSGRWILPANICPIVPAVFHKARKDFIFCDISLSSYCLNEELVLGLLKKHRNEIAGIFYVRTYGVALDPGNLFIKAKNISEGLHLIDDRCLCQPSFECKDSDADLVLYSTGYAKFVELGIGGWGLLREGHEMKTSSQGYCPREHERLLGSFRESLEGAKPFLYQDGDWLDMRPPGLDFTEYCRIVSGKIPEVRSHKSLLNAIYAEYLGDFALPDNYHDWRYNITCKNPEDIIAEAFRTGLFASRHYKPLIPSFGSGEAPNSSLLSSRVVNLFNDFRLNVESAEVLAKALKKIVKK